jgi:hypothetical protein
MEVCMLLDSSYISCGVSELSQLDEDPDSDLASSMDDILNEGSPFYLFSDTVDRNRGERLRTYILKHHLGSVLRSRVKTNPNSGNDIRVFIWTVDYKKFKSWAIKHREQKL